MNKSLERVLVYVLAMGTVTDGYPSIIATVSDTQLLYDSMYQTLLIKTPGYNYRIENVNTKDISFSVMSYLESLEKELYHNYFKVCSSDEVVSAYAKLIANKTLVESKGWIMNVLDTVKAIHIHKDGTLESYFVFLDEREVLAFDGYSLNTFAALCSIADIVQTEEVQQDVIEVSVPKMIQHLITYTLVCGDDTDEITMTKVLSGLKLRVDTSNLSLYLDTQNGSYDFSDIYTLNDDALFALNGVYALVKYLYANCLQIDDSYAEILDGILDDYTPKIINCREYYAINGVYVMRVAKANIYEIRLHETHTILFDGNSGEFFDYGGATKEDLLKAVNDLALPIVVTFSDALLRYTEVRNLELSTDVVEQVLKLCGVNVDKITNTILNELLR